MRLLWFFFFLAVKTKLRNKTELAKFVVEIVYPYVLQDVESLPSAASGERKDKR